MLSLRPRWYVVCLAIVASLSIPALLSAQGTAGRVIGRVADPSGALLTGVKVTLVNEATNVSRDTKTNENGDYDFVEVPVGTYRLEFDLTGFKKNVRRGVSLDINQVVTLNTTMQVGATQEVVDVTSEAPFGRGRSNNFSVNGGDANDQFVNLPTVQPSPDSIAEFRVLTNTFDAEYGRNSGSVVNVVTKSGTNAVHGNLYEFFRNTKLNANPFCFTGVDGEGSRRHSCSFLLRPSARVPHSPILIFLRRLLSLAFWVPHFLCSSAPAVLRPSLINRGLLLLMESHTAQMQAGLASLPTWRITGRTSFP